MAIKKRSDRLNWDDLKYFSALADSGTISAAATRLGVNYVTVSRRIDRLEEVLKRQLFNRTNEGYFLTLEGDDLYKHLPPVQELFEQITESANTSDNSSRMVRVSMVHSLADRVVAPHFVGLQRRYPNLTIEIDVSTRNVNITKRESDIALRLGLPESGDYISRRLSYLDYVLCGSEELVNRARKGESVPTISFGSEFSQLPEAKYIYNNFGIESVVLRSNSATIQQSAASAGIGIAMLPKYLLLQSNLKRLDQRDPLRREIWLLVRKNTSQITGVRLVIDNLVKLFRDKRSMLEDEYEE